MDFSRRGKTLQPMDEFKYEVFKGIPKKNPFWLGSVSGLERATELMNRMADRLPGDYFVSRAITAEVVAATYLIYDPTEAGFIQPFK